MIGKKLELTGVVSLSLDYKDSDVSKAIADADDDDNLIADDISVGGNPTRINIEGQYDIGENMALIYELSKSVVWDGTRDKMFNTRSYFVGLRGVWGTALMGRYDTQFRRLGSQFAVLTSTVAHRNSILGASSNRGNQLNRRAEKTIFWTNDIQLRGGSFRWNLQYSPDAVPSDSDPDLKDRAMWGAGVEREVSSYTLALAHDRWEKIYGGKVNSTRIVIKKKQGVVELGLIAENINHTLATGGPGTLDRNAFGANIVYERASWTYGAQMLMADDYTGADDTGALMLSIGAEKQVSDSLLFSVGYSQTSNDVNAAYQGIDGSRGDLGTLPGRTPSAFGLSLRYSF